MKFICQSLIFFVFSVAVSILLGSAGPVALWAFEQRISSIELILGKDATYALA